MARVEERLERQLDNSSRNWVAFQETKGDPEQPTLASQLAPSDRNEYDVCVVGTGPAGLAAAAALAAEGLGVVVVGPDQCFVNNYGVFLDELEAIGGLEHTVVQTYDRMDVWLGEGEYKDLGRKYARVGRRELREHLLGGCKRGGVQYRDALVGSLDHHAAGTTVELAGGGQGAAIEAKLAVLAIGHNRELVEYETGPRPTMQTAYGVELHWEDHPWPLDAALFMDFRHQAAEFSEAAGAEAEEWRRWPSILYAFPVDKDTVFIQETCLVAPTTKAVPFDELKARLRRRLDRMGLGDAYASGEVRVLEEEASWIPLGGTVPVAPQRAVAWGASAGMVHPVSGYHIANMLERAPVMARAVAEGLRGQGVGEGGETVEGGPEEAARRAWATIWSDDRRRQQGFYQFGMEMMLTFPPDILLQFFRTFFGLPNTVWQKFLSHGLGGLDLIAFALRVFAIAPNSIRWRLVAHITHEGAGVRAATAYCWPLLRAAGVTAGRGGMRTDRRAPWLPVLRSPPHLDGSLPGDRGFDPVQMTARCWVPPFYANAEYCEGGRLGYLREVELTHGRWAMLAAVGCLAPELMYGVNWADAGARQDALFGGSLGLIDLRALAMLREAAPGDAAGDTPVRLLLATQLVLMAGAELARASGATTEGRVYPGGAFFDPLGLASEVAVGRERVDELRLAEVKHARLAMVAMAGLWAQVVCTHTGPLSNWADFTDRLHYLFVSGLDEALKSGALPLPAFLRGALAAAAV